MSFPNVEQMQRNRLAIIGCAVVSLVFAATPQLVAQRRSPYAAPMQARCVAANNEDDECRAARPSDRRTLPMTGTAWTLTEAERRTLAAALDALLPPAGSFPRPRRPIRSVLKVVFVTIYLRH